MSTVFKMLRTVLDFNYTFSYKKDLLSIKFLMNDDG